MADTGLIIDPGNNYAQLVHVDGTVRLDTRHEMFHILNFSSGSLSRPLYESSVGLPRHADIDLGAVDPSCEGVLGLVRIDFVWESAKDLQLESGLWYAAGGTIVLNLMRRFQIDGDFVQYIANHAFITFAIVDGRLRYQEEICQSNGFNTALSAFTVTYRIYCGLFT